MAKKVKAVTGGRITEGGKVEEVTTVSRRQEEFVRAQRRLNVAELYLRGYTQARIAQELGCSEPTVKKDLTYLMEQWVTESRLAFDQRKAKELARIDRLEEMAHRGWTLSLERQEVHRSLKKQVRQQVRNADNKVTGHRMVPVEETTEVVVKGQGGDPRFLEEMRKCVEMRMRILGLWKEGNTNVTNVTLDWTGMFKAQAEDARLKAQAHEARLGVREVLEVQPVHDQSHDALDQHNCTSEHTKQDVNEGTNSFSGSNMSSFSNSEPSSPENVGAVEDDPIEARIRQEEVKKRFITRQDYERGPVH